MPELPTALCVEDDPLVAKVMKLTLTAGGMRMLHAGSAAAARQICGTERPQIVVLDIGLPDGPGYDLVPWLERNLSPAPPVIAVSASAMSEDRRRAFAAGCREFIPKPIDTRTFGAHVAQVATA